MDDFNENINEEIPLVDMSDMNNRNNENNENEDTGNQETSFYPDSNIPNPEYYNDEIQISSILGKADFIENEFGLESSEDNKELYNNIEITRNKASGRVNGMTYKGEKILVSKGGEFVYTKDVLKQNDVKEFRSLLENLTKKQSRKNIRNNEQQLDSNEQEDVRQIAVENIRDLVENETEGVLEQLKGLNIPEKTRREINSILQGSVLDKKFGEAQDPNFRVLLDNQLEQIKVNKNYFLDLSIVERDARLKKLYEKAARIQDLQMDIIRINHGLEPKDMVGLKILENELENGDVSRFKRLSRWMKENFGALAGITSIGIGLTGIIATVVIGTRNYLKKGARAVGSFGKALAKLGKELGPLISAIVGLASNIVGLTAKGISFLPNNLWLLVVAVFVLLYEKYYGKT